ncbi:MAG: proline dehydrogenase family protein [Nitrospirota bacterium]|nr:proline dehydrogenase family protein [Nitrospirota bacterium]
MAYDLLDTSIRKIEHALVQQAQGHAPRIWGHRWWTRLLLDWGTRDDQFKVQLFRFIDVLPALQTDEQFVRLLHEYFHDVRSLPTAFRWLLIRGLKNPLMARVGTRVLRYQFLKMAYTFMAGQSVERALPTLTHLWNHRCACSIDLLGEATVSETEADRYHQRCLQTLMYLEQATLKWKPQPLLEHDHLGPLPRIQLSIKLSALYSQLDPIDFQASYEGIAPRLRSIIEKAQTIPASITFDMEQAELGPLIVDIFTRLFSEAQFRDYPHASIALQAYLTHSAQTLDTLLDWGKTREVPFGIRLVKGAYWDSEVIRYRQRGWPVPVYLNKHETDANYEALTKTILEHSAFVRPAFGSHHIPTLAYVQALSAHLHLRPETCEYQMLYGMAEPLRESVVEQGFRFRVYTPIGELIPGMSYLVRRLLENTANESVIHGQYGTSESQADALVFPTPTDHEKGEIPLAETDVFPTIQATKERFSNEPLTDFSCEDTHHPITQALARIMPHLGQTVSYPVAASVPCHGPTLVSINPSQPEQVIATFPTVLPVDIDPLVREAQARMASWRRVPAQTRADVLFRTAALMRNQRAELTAWEILETGKPWREADADVAEAIDFLEFYGRDMCQLGQLLRLGTEPGELNQRVFLPRGLALVLPPWNFSLAIPTGLVSAALVTGNIVLFKPSERAPMMGYHLSRLFREASLPEGVLHFLPGGPDLGKMLVQHPAIHVIAFTGSQTVGLNILQQASQVLPGQRHIKHVIAEMGGKNAIIVDETADLDEAITGVLDSVTGYQGQKCSACSRVIVVESVYSIFLERLRQAAANIPIGPTIQAKNRMGPLIDDRALERVRHYVELGKQDGICQLDRQTSGPGYFQGPVILTNLSPTHPVVQEEIFGPVVVVFHVPTIHEAFALANDSPFALTGGIYSRSPANLQLARERLEVGNLYINRPITGSLVGRQPFGGHRLSGIGKKAGGHGYLEQFMVEKIITENTLRRGFAPTS